MVSTQELQQQQQHYHIPCICMKGENHGSETPELRTKMALPTICFFFKSTEIHLWKLAKRQGNTSQ